MGSQKCSKLKPVHYNLENESELFEHAQKCKPSYSEWVKEQQRREIIKERTGIDPEVKALVERLIETKIAGYKLQPTDKSNEDFVINIANDLDAFLR